ncbi:MAG: sulfatase-like hydrolase/transferase [Pseudomonadota bacterium]
MAGQRNILLISLDDCGAYWKFRDAFGERLQTPNLDRICEIATVFQNAYCQVPVCGPSRSSFMSGLAPHQTGIFDNYASIFDAVRPEQMWPFRLKEAGYYCSTAGKVHHGYRPLPPEIHRTLYSHPAEDLGNSPGVRSARVDFGGMMRGWGTTDPAQDEKYYDAASAASAERFLRSYSRDAPFYRECGFRHPHSPYPTPIRFKELYDETAFVPPESWAAGWDRNAFADTFMRENIDSRALSFWQKSVRNYFSAISHVDEQIGRVWDALQASPHAGETVVAIIADHGYHLGDKNRFRKYTLWEEAAGVPFILYDPAQPRGQVVTDPVALLDLGPTILDYAGCPPLEGCAGRSLRPQVDGADVTGRTVPTFFYGSASVRRGDLRYIRYQDGSSQLYDLAADPWQLRDLSGESDRVDEMRACLAETCLDYGLAVDTAERAGAFTSVTAETAAPHRLPSGGVIAVDTPDVAVPDPGNRVLYATLREETDLTLADGFRAVRCASDYRFGIHRFGLIGNDLGNDVDFSGGHARFTLDVVCGEGDDRITTALDPVHLRLTAGDNEVRVGEGGGRIVAGRGRDRVIAGTGPLEVLGGPGELVVQGGAAQLIVVTGHGTTRITCGAGRTIAVLAAGGTIIEAGEAPLDLVAQRTARKQTIHGFRNGTLDLRDWDALPPPRLEIDEDGVLLRCVDETLLFTGTAPEVIADAMTPEIRNRLA